MKNFIVIFFLVLMTIFTTNIPTSKPTTDSFAGASTTPNHETSQSSIATIDGTAAPSLNNNALLDGVVSADVIIDSVAAASTFNGDSSKSSTSTTINNKEFDDDDNNDDGVGYEEGDD